ncbi:hypothetical protein BJX61DRAFT_495337 [Aspergillus egyptiacus]|nr:hypothetical protein BJX61DRAFT_495337 [Aspergillus egyptiacus]
MLRSQFREGLEFQSKGHLQIPIQDWGALSFLLLLLIIHGRTRSVPRKVTVRTLTDIAVLVDYYECYEVVGVYSDMWIDGLQGRLPTWLCQDAWSWLFISWVFHKGDIFQKITEVIQYNCSGFFDTRGLPIPPPIIEALDKRRIAYIATILAAIDDLFDGFIDGRVGCINPSSKNSACAHTALGALTQRLVQMKLLMPKPESPYIGIAINTLLSDCRSRITSPVVHDRGPYSSRPEYCTLEKRIPSILDSLKGPCGLHIDGDETYNFKACRK